MKKELWRKKVEDIIFDKESSSSTKVMKIIGLIENNWFD